MLLLVSFAAIILSTTHASGKYYSSFCGSYHLNTLSHKYLYEDLYSRNWSVVFVPGLEKGDVALAKLRIF